MIRIFICPILPAQNPQRVLSPIPYVGKESGA
jgi:hypothetical protein